MKILIFNDRPDYMGGTAYYQRFKRLLLLHGVDVEIKQINNKFIFLGRIDVFIWKTFGISLLSFFRLSKILNSDVKFVYGSNYFLPKVIREKLGIKCLCWFPDFQVHDFPHYFTNSQIKRRLKYEKKAVQSCDAITVQNNADKIRLQKLIADKPILIFSFYEQYNFTNGNAINIKNGKPDYHQFILVAAQAWMHKRIDKIVQAHNNSSKKIGLVIIGKLYDQRNPDYAKLLKKLLSKTDAAFLGYVSESRKLELLSSCTAVLNYSLYEGWNSSVEEAIAHKKPIVLSDTDFHRDQVPGAMFINSDEDLIKIFSGDLEVESNVDYEKELTRRKFSVKKFIQEINEL